MFIHFVYGFITAVPLMLVQFWLPSVFGLLAIIAHLRFLQRERAQAQALHTRFTSSRGKRHHTAPVQRGSRGIPLTVDGLLNPDGVQAVLEAPVRV